MKLRRNFGVAKRDINNVLFIDDHQFDFVKFVFTVLVSTCLLNVCFFFLLTVNSLNELGIKYKERCVVYTVRDQKDAALAPKCNSGETSVSSQRALGSP